MLPQARILAGRRALALSCLSWAAFAAMMALREIALPWALVVAMWATLPHLALLVWAIRFAPPSWSWRVLILSFALGSAGTYQYCHSLIALRSTLNVVDLYTVPLIQVAAAALALGIGLIIRAVRRDGRS